MKTQHDKSKLPQNLLLAPHNLPLPGWGFVSLLTLESCVPSVRCKQGSCANVKSCGGMAAMSPALWHWHTDCGSGRAASFPSSCTSLEWLEGTGLLTEAFRALCRNVSRLEGLKPAMTHMKIKHFWKWKDHLSPLNTKPLFFPSPQCKLFGKEDLLSLLIQVFKTMWYLIFFRKEIMKKQISLFFSLQQFKLEED